MEKSWKNQGILNFHVVEITLETAIYRNVPHRNIRITAHNEWETNDIVDPVSHLAACETKVKVV